MAVGGVGETVGAPRVGDRVGPWVVGLEIGDGGDVNSLPRSRAPILEASPFRVIILITCQLFA